MQQNSQAKAYKKGNLTIMDICMEADTEDC